jgi:hypothetical protein
MKHLVLVSLIFSAFNANAALAPAYDNISKVDAAITAIASKPADGLAIVQPEDVTIHSVQVASQGHSNVNVITVDAGYLICNVVVTPLPLQKGWAGATEYKGALNNKCTRYKAVAPVITMKYVDVRKELVKYAAKNLIAIAFKIEGTPQGPRVNVGPLN